MPKYRQLFARGPGVITFQSPVPMAIAPDVLQELYIQ